MATIKSIIEYILSFIAVALFLSFCIYFLAVRIRYYFLKLIGKEKSIKYLEGESDDDGANYTSHGCLNLIIGMILFVLFAFGIGLIFLAFDK